MKKIFILLLMIGAQAHSEGEKQISKATAKAYQLQQVIPQVNMNYSNLVGGDSSRKYTDGSGIAALAELTTNVENLKLLAGFEYQQTGSTQKFGELGLGIALAEVKTTLNYIGIPVRAKYIYHANQENDYYVTAGLGLNYLASAKIQASGMVNDTSEHDVSSAFNKTDIGTQVGLGYRQPIYGGNMTVEAEYRKGLQNVIKGEQAKNQSFGLNVGYIIQM